MEKINLYQLLARYLSVKEMKVSDFDLKEAKNVMLKKKKSYVSDVRNHAFFEDTIEEAAKRISELEVRDGILYIYLKGDNCTQRLNKIMTGLSINCQKIIVFGSSERWPTLPKEKVRFIEDESIFTNDHQRFFIFDSRKFSLNLIAHKVNNKTKALVSSNKAAVKAVSQALAVKL